MQDIKTRTKIYNMATRTISANMEQNNSHADITLFFFSLSSIQFTVLYRK